MITVTFFELIILILLTFSLICGMIGVYVSIRTAIELKAMQQSTHKMEYVPMDPKWASSDEQIEELEEQQISDFPPMDSDDLDESEIDLKKMI